jgi:DNA-binding Lrp family transcriptional regulator
MKLITHLRIIAAGDFIPNFPDFRYYNPHVKQWRFEWGKWLTELRKAPSTTIEDPEGHPLLADKKDVLIVKELEKNARRTFADLAPIVGITLQGVKYHYDKRLVGDGIIEHFMFDVVPYPIEVAAYHEVMLEFASARDMNRFYSILNDLFWVLGVSKVLRRNALLVRTYMLQSQLANMFAFFSEMAKTQMLESYSSVRLDFAGRQVQTISYELFDDEKGWTFDLRKCISDLSKLR